MSPVCESFLNQHLKCPPNTGVEGEVTLSQVSEPSIISTLNKFESTKVQLSQVQLKQKGDEESI